MGSRCYDQPWWYYIKNVGVFFIKTAKVWSPTKKKTTWISKMIRNPKVDEVKSEKNHPTAKDGDLHSGLNIAK